MRTSLEILTMGASPVSVAELCAWLRVNQADETPSLLTALLGSATEAVRDYTGRSVTEMTIRKTWLDPVRLFHLDYPPVLSVDSLVAVSSSGTPRAITSYQVSFDGVLRLRERCFGAELVCEYRTTPVVSSSVYMAILKAAAYMYERRGDCDSDSAIQNSGAAGDLAPLRAVLL
jgi:hypothetical protein